MSGFTHFDYHFYHAGHEFAIRWISCGKSTCTACPHGPYFYEVTQKFGKGALKYYGKHIEGVGTCGDYAITLWRAGRMQAPGPWLVAKGLITKGQSISADDRLSGAGGENAQCMGNTAYSGLPADFKFRNANPITAKFESMTGTILGVVIKGIKVYEWTQKSRPTAFESHGRGCDVCGFGEGMTSFDEATLLPYRDTGFPPPPHLSMIGPHLVCEGCLIEGRRTSLQLMQVIPGFSPTRHQRIKELSNELKLWKKVIALVYPKK